MFGNVNYTSKVPPLAYRCTRCNAHGVRLWREYNVFANRTEITCCKCTHECEGRPLVMNASSQIGWRVAAVPTPSGDAFWGYSSVPSNARAWWHALPVSASVDA